MDLIHANADRLEAGFVDDYIKYDAEISSDADLNKNQFVLTMDEAAWKNSGIKEGHFLYIPFSEFGGPIEYIKHSTKSAQITLTGPTWRGMLIRKIIEPPSGLAYLTISGMEANAAIASLVGDKFGDFFGFSDVNTEKNVSGSWRYNVLLSGLVEALRASGLSLVCGYDNTIRRATLAARAISDYSGLVDLSQDYGIHLTSQQGGLEAYNHIIALGRGELSEREVVHLYRLDDGAITINTIPNRGEKDLCATLDYPNAESTEELIKSAKKRLEECSPSRSVEMDTSETGLTLNLGDKVSARDRLTGLVTVATVISKQLVLTSTSEKLETKVN